MSKPVFISHAVTNHDLADRLVDLLETGVGISDGDMFCSSLQGLGIPSGVNFAGFIRGQIREPRVVVLLLSQAYLNSQFCLCELGAAWVLSHRVIPLLVPPLEYKDVKAVLTGIQVLKLADSGDLNQMQADLVDALSIKRKPFARWEANRTKFLEWFADYEKAQPVQATVTPDQFADLNSKYDEAVNEIGVLEAELTGRDQLIEQLKKAKDAAEVKDIVADSLGDVKRFEEIVKQAKAALAPLPNVVCEAIYYEMRGEYLQWPDAFDDYRKAEIKSAVEEDYLRDRDEGLEPIGDDPKVSRAIDALREVERFTHEVQDDPDFLGYYADNYDHRMNFESRRFWETHLL